MSKNWSLALVIAFVLGYGLKVYLEEQKQIKAAKEQAVIDAMVVDPIFYGEGTQPVHIFDKSDPRTRIVYFGYTRCPDVCPTSLAMLSAALNNFNKEQLSHFRPMFISIDPERDDAALAHKYAQYFHPDIEGFSAPYDLTKPVADKYGVIFKKTELEGSAMEYVVDHSSYFYFLKPDGTLITSVPHTLEPSPISREIQKLLQK